MTSLPDIWEQAKRDMASEPKLSVPVEQVKHLIEDQLPELADLPISPVAESGWDNCTFHLGDALSVRLPTSSFYAGQVVKEHAWLPILAGQLSLQIPEPVFLGKPGHGYPFHWSVNRWIAGTTLTQATVADPLSLAADVAAFLLELHQCETRNAPASGLANFFRGGDLSVYAIETGEMLDRLQGQVDRGAIEAVWQAALDQPFDGRPVWVHGDMASGNLLLRDSRLAAVIDFGCSAVGDPACDLAMAWTWFDARAAAVFRDRVGQDAGTWARARGWVVWKTLHNLSRQLGKPGEKPTRVLLQRILDDPVLA